MSADGTNREAMRREFHAWRGLDEHEICEDCDGSGASGYANSATWTGGVGGMTLSGGACATCWGSGSSLRPGVNLRALMALAKRLPEVGATLRAARGEAAHHGESAASPDEPVERTASGSPIYAHQEAKDWQICRSAGHPDDDGSERLNIDSFFRGTLYIRWVNADGTVGPWLMWSGHLLLLRRLLAKLKPPRPESAP